MEQWPSQILKLLGNSLRQLSSTSEMPSTSKVAYFFSSTRGDHSISNTIISSSGSAQLIFSDVFIVCIFVLIWLRAVLVFFMTYFSAKDRILTRASFQSICAKTEILDLERKSNHKKIPLLSVIWIVRYVLCCFTESQMLK